MTTNNTHTYLLFPINIKGGSEIYSSEDRTLPIYTAQVMIKQPTPLKVKIVWGFVPEQIIRRGLFLTKKGCVSQGFHVN
jgi:hypothetical protein